MDAVEVEVVVDIGVVVVETEVKDVTTAVEVGVVGIVVAVVVTEGVAQKPG